MRYFADGAITYDDKKYIDLCQAIFSQETLFIPMSQRQDCLITCMPIRVPKAIGFERIAELTGDETYHAAGSFFWDIIVTGERSLAFGGNSRREHFPSKEACTDFINDIDGPGVMQHQ